MLTKEFLQEYAKTHAKSEPFCPFIAAYCDSRDYSECDTCLLLKLYRNELTDNISED